MCFGYAAFEKPQSVSRETPLGHRKKLSHGDESNADMNGFDSVIKMTTGALR
jgi:hypothetical protein